jgi:hypothetical protein
MMTIALASVIEGIVILAGGEYKPTMMYSLINLKRVFSPPESLIGLIVSAVVVVILMVIFPVHQSRLAMGDGGMSKLSAARNRVTMVYALAGLSPA